MFGPGQDNARAGAFIVEVPVASPDGCAPPVPMKAFAQPCWSAGDILPLDSGWERASLDIMFAVAVARKGTGSFPPVTSGIKLDF